MRWCFFLALFFSLTYGAGERCGTMRFIEELKKNPQKKMSVKKYNAASSTVVQNKMTQHFIIYYVTDGTNAIKTSAYIDSLAKYLEQAYDLHKNTLGMKSISGTARTAFYGQVVPSGIYPIEVIDTGEWDFCGTYGLTFPYDSRKPRETQIAIENDFIYGVNCPEAGRRKGDPFTSSINGDYSKKWHLALKVTVFHELYHSFQMTQFDFINNANTFWLEASAVGVEEMGASEVNDYIDYLPSVFYYPGETIDTLSSSSIEAYAYATLYLFLSSELGLKFDSYIWDYFSKYPKEIFSVQLARYINSQGGETEDIENLFHKYATHIFYSGSRAAQSPYSPFSADMPMWPNWRMKTSSPAYLHSGTFDFIRTLNGAAPNTDSVARTSSLKYGRNNDSTIWVLSRLLAKEFVPPVAVPPPKEFAAYPNPWRPKTKPEIKFGPLPKDSKGVEIRSSNGALLERIKGKTGDTLTWQPKKLPAPGILYYRSLPYEKNKMLILEY